VKDGVKPVERVQLREIRKSPAKNGYECEKRAVRNAERPPPARIIPAILQDYDAKNDMENFMPSLRTMAVCDEVCDEGNED
jgi:hypothetical protein